MRSGGALFWIGEAPAILAQSGAGGRSMTPYLVAIGVLIIVVVVAGLALMYLRGRLHGDEAGEEFGAGGVLDAMRTMRDRGEISEDEYRTAQASIVAKASAGKDENTEADQPAPARARTRPPLPGEIQARPGFDLTGDPLPPVVRDGDAGPGAPKR